MELKRLLCPLALSTRGGNNAAPEVCTPGSGDEDACGDSASGLGCVDDFGAGNAAETLQVAVTGGEEVTSFVFSFLEGDVGPFTSNLAVQ